MSRFEGQVLLATGGGSGIAAATARRFASEGGRVAVLDLSAERAEGVASELDGSIALACDVADEDAVAAAVSSAHEQLGRIDCVLNAAGIADFGPIGEWPLERFDRMLRIHVGGTFLVCKHVAPLMDGGAIVNLASIAAITAQPFNAPYGAAKAAISGYTRQLALELGPEIRVNAVAPGRIRTGMTEPLNVQRGGGARGRAPGRRAQHLQARRGARGDRRAGCFLFSDDASFLTGQTITVDGGETIL